jgi:type I restriction enzyme S subunit
MQNWETQSISSLCEKIFSGGTPNTNRAEYWNGKLKWLSSGETRNKFIFDTEKMITELGAKESSTRLAQSGDVVMASAGQGYTRGQVSLLKTDTYVNQSVIVFRTNSRELLSEYLFYNLSNRYEELRALSDSNSIRGSITTKLFNSMEISIPSLSIQKQIVEILGSIDEKIENNRKINHHLEEMIHLYFSSFFIEKTHEKSSLGEVCTITLGGTPSRSKPEYWNGTIPWINSGEINKFRIIEPSERITELGVTKSATKLLPKHTTVLAITGATLGQVSLLEIASCANQSVVGTQPSDKLPYTFIYPFVIDRIHQLIAKQTGGAQQHINKGNVEELEIPIYSDALIKEYNSISEPLFEAISNNCFENERLTELRDSLLPKLMSGEITVSD